MCQTVIVLGNSSSSMHLKKLNFPFEIQNFHLQSCFLRELYYACLACGPRVQNPVLLGLNLTSLVPS
jgi:hypothetical protein